MRKIYILLLAMLSCVVSAYAFDVDGISYNITKEATDESPGEVEVIGGEIKEVIEFPETVTYDDVTYTVTAIGNNAFSGRSNSENFTKKYVIPGTVRAIGDHAFYDNYYLEEVEFHEGLRSIGAAAFAFNFALKEIRLPSTLSTIDDSGFLTNQNSNIAVYCNAATPPEIHAKAFEGRTTGPLHVTVADVEAYQEADYWKDFTEIIGDIEFTDRCYSPIIAIDNNLLTMSCKTEGAAIYYTTDGSTPDENDNRYTSPIPFTNTQIIRAIAIAESLENSAIRTYYDKEAIDNITNVTDEQGVLYTLKQAVDGSYYYAVTGHSDELDTEIVIPEKLNGYLVRAIEDNVFNGCSGLVSINIPNSVTTIGARAFEECSNLTSVILGDQLTTIGEYAFTRCGSLSSIDIPNSVNNIGEFAFSDCTSLTSVVIPNSVTSIGKSVFQGCSSLNTVTLGVQLITIADYAFSGCTSLSSVTIPNSVTAIGAWAFEGCTSLSSIRIPNSVISIGERAFQNCNSLTTVTLGNQLTTIGGYAFTKCENLSSIIIPNSVSDLGEFAFAHCSGLTSVKISNGITSLKAGTFYGCSGLSTIQIPNSIKSIEDGVDAYQDGYGTGWGCGPYCYGVFAYCSNLTSVKIGENVISLGAGAFSWCSSLTSITLHDKLENIGAKAFSACFSLTSVNFGTGITSIGNDAFSNCAFTSFTVPNSVTTIGEGAFSSNYKLTTIALGDGISEIKNGTFSSCTALSSIIIPDGVTSIGSEAFQWCQTLTSIKLSSSLTSLGERVFSDCPQLKSIELPNSFTVIPEGLFSGNNFQYIKLGNNVKSIGKNSFGSSELILEIGTATPPTIDKDAFPNIEYLSDINVIVPNAKAETAYKKKAVWEDMTFSNQSNISEVTVETPGDLSFELITQCNMMPAKVVDLKVNGTINADDFSQMLVNMKSLLRLDLSDCDITEIPAGALKDKTQLQALILPTSLQTIGQGAFQNCLYLQELTMQNGLQTIGQSAFQGCGYLTGELELPSTVTAIGESAFVGTAYTSVKLSSALKSIGDNAFQNLSIAQRLVLPNRMQSVGVRAFAGTKITGLVIPDGVTTIGEEAFADTPIEGHVTIPDGVTSLGARVFRNTQISTVFLPNSIETVSEGLFQGCQNLDLVYVPDNYTGLASSVFDGCGNLTVLRLSANLATMGEYSLQNTPLEYVKVPSQVETLSRGVLKNCTKLESLTLPASLTSVEDEALYGCTALRNMSVEALTPPTVRGKNAIRGINTDKCLISIPTSAYKNYVLAEYWGQFVQMRNDIAVVTAGNGEIAFESVEEEEDEEEEEASAREFTPRFARKRAARRAPQFASEEDSKTYVSNGSSVYAPEDGKVRFIITPAPGEELISATLDGVDIMPDIVDGVYTATADKKNAKLVVKFSGQGSAVMAGDVNGDGNITAQDASLVLQLVAKKISQDTEGVAYKAADVNGDGNVTAQDASLILQYVAKKINW